MKKGHHEQHLGSSEKTDAQATGAAAIAIHNYSITTTPCPALALLPKSLNTFRFIRLLDLINVPQMGGDSYYDHFIDEETEAWKGVK